MDNNNNNETGFLFNVDILVKSKSNALALQSLIELINGHHGEIVDYRIKSGIELGEIIEASLAAKRKSMLTPSLKSKAADNQGQASSKEQAVPASPSKSLPVRDTKGSQINDWVQSYITSNRLVRLVIEGAKGRVNIPCRILNYVADTEMLSVYHVDEKQVYTYKLSEIVDILDV
ncbi:hypothetical protein DCC85_07140 [Paenibacillus sp. CAA11]|uniref:hypothetical protein n=1 Tax=Paenibacillus sp. CAA11 TaxID=1532905 RepID=UPI000D378422|nr:hypothetical protein [Paenibacillus sp. CAA11]AWB44010.1 hypothetical protein DCC85_07140 [Paenibacillus sp. CAA11]